MPLFDPFPQISSGRLLLRQLKADDNLPLFAMRSDQRIVRFLNRPPASSLAETDLFIRNLHNYQREEKSILWAICVKPDPLLIGTITLWKIDWPNCRAELGYMLEARSQGLGYMQEAVKAVLDFAFRYMNLHSIQADVNPQNSSSIKVLEKAGFIREAYFRETYFYNGRFLDSAMYGILSPLEHNAK